MRYRPPLLEGRSPTRRIIGPLLAQLGGFRHSDTAVVTDGRIELVTYYPRDLESLVPL